VTTESTEISYIQLDAE